MAASIDPPFQVATANDRWYQPMMENNFQKFWKQHRGCGISMEARQLITKMLLYDPAKRINMSDITKDTWYNGEIFSLCHFLFQIF